MGAIIHDRAHEKPSKNAINTPKATIPVETENPANTTEVNATSNQSRAVLADDEGLSLVNSFTLFYKHYTEFNYLQTKLLCFATDICRIIRNTYFKDYDIKKKNENDNDKNKVGDSLSDISYLLEIIYEKLLLSYQQLPILDEVNFDIPDLPELGVRLYQKFKVLFQLHRRFLDDANESKVMVRGLSRLYWSKRNNSHYNLAASEILQNYFLNRLGDCINRMVSMIGGNL